MADTEKLNPALIKLKKRCCNNNNAKGVKKANALRVANNGSNNGNNNGNTGANSNTGQSTTGNGPSGSLKINFDQGSPGRNSGVKGQPVYPPQPSTYTGNSKTQPKKKSSFFSRLFGLDKEPKKKPIDNSTYPVGVNNRYSGRYPGSSGYSSSPSYQRDYYQSSSSPRIMAQDSSQLRRGLDSNLTSGRNSGSRTSSRNTGSASGENSSRTGDPSKLNSVADSNSSKKIKSMNITSEGMTKNNSNTGSKVNSNSSIYSKASNTVKSIKQNLIGDTGKKILLILVVAVVTFLIMWFVRKWLLDTRNANKYSPFLIEGSKSGKSSVVISTDPSKEDSIPLYRSDGQDGAEFTYSFWMVIESMEYNFGKWKHVFHRGNKTSFPNRAPGVWIHPEQNTLRVYMNTQENPLEYVDIENVPVRKWFHCSISLNHKYLDVYFNGKLKHRKELKSAPRQNYGEFWSGLFGGFEGYLSRVRYFNKSLEFNEIEKIVKAGPSRDACGDTGDYPPYLDDDWWFDMKF